MLAKAQAAAAQAAQQAREAAERAAKQGTEALAKAQSVDTDQLMGNAVEGLESRLSGSFAKVAQLGAASPSSGASSTPKKSKPKLDNLQREVAQVHLYATPERWAPSHPPLPPCRS